MAHKLHNICNTLQKVSTSKTVQCFKAREQMLAIHLLSMAMDLGQGDMLCVCGFRTLSFLLVKKKKLTANKDPRMGQLLSLNA